MAEKSWALPEGHDSALTDDEEISPCGRFMSVTFQEHGNDWMKLRVFDL